MPMASAGPRSCASRHPPGARRLLVLTAGEPLGQPDAWSIRRLGVLSVSDQGHQRRYEPGNG